MKMVEALEALQRLREGNRRFVASFRDGGVCATNIRYNEQTEARVPFATILACSDARVPAELVFDQPLGDLFVVRAAGNIVARSQVGSLEFAAERTGMRLVVVLGHSGCGAVRATLEEIASPSNTKSSGLTSIVDQICPPFLSLMGSKEAQNIDALMPRAVKTNIRSSVRQLRAGSPLIERLVRECELLIVGAEYLPQTGAVEFLDGSL